MMDSNAKHGHEKDYKIIVNGTEHAVANDIVTFEEVVEIAFPGHPTNPDIVFSVTFEHAESKPHQGTLATGGKVTVKKHCTVFDVTQTNRS
jgi:Multiubiquitin